jgi:hypothetical protein
MDQAAAPVVWSLLRAGLGFYCLSLSGRCVAAVRQSWRQERKGHLHRTGRSREKVGHSQGQRDEAGHLASAK